MRGIFALISTDGLAEVRASVSAPGSFESSFGSSAFSSLFEGTLSICSPSVVDVFYF